MEGHLTMSKKERARLVVMAKVMKSEMKISEASELLGLIYRQTFRIASGMGRRITRTRVAPLPVLELSLWRKYMTFLKSHDTSNNRAFIITPLFGVG